MRLAVLFTNATFLALIAYQWKTFLVHDTRGYAHLSGVADIPLGTIRQNETSSDFLEHKC